MKRLPSLLPLFSLSLILLSITTAAFAQNPWPDPAQADQEYVEGEVIIKFKKNSGPSLAAAVAADLQATVEKPLRSIGAELWQIRGISVEDAVARYRNNPNVEYIEPNYLYHALDTFPNDPRFNELWGMHNTGQTGGVADVDVDAPEAWDIVTGDTIILVGVIDTGVDYNHEDLAANIWTNPGEIAGNGIDDDGNGYVDDVRGWDFPYNDNDPMDVYGHGTHVSGTIGGVGNNGIGVAGVCWKVKILPIKFLNDGGSGTTADAILSVEYANMMGVRLTNNSWGGGPFSQALKDAIAAADSLGMLFVAASGNGYSNTDVYPAYPASYDNPNIISVANIMHDDQLRPSSNYGVVTVDLGAPGTDVLSTIPNNGYMLGTGTSMASPHVAGACALLWSAAPSLSHDEIKDIILSSVEQTPVLIGKTLTGGRLNIFNMLSGLDSIPPAPVTDLEIVATGSSTVTLTWTATGDDSTDGSARSYDIRFSTTPIDPTSFDSATPFTGVPNPQPAGTTETARLSGLDFNTAYHFALKAVDEQGNASTISNVVSGITLGVPQLVFAPDSLSDSLLTGGKAAHVVTIKNTGDGTLDFEFPDLDEPASGPSPAPGQETAISWLKASPREGTVFSGDSVEVLVSIDATGLFGGVHTAPVILTSNDPAWPMSTLFVRILVTNAPDITVSPGSIDYGKHFQNATVLDSVIVANVGFDPLQVLSVSTDNPDYLVDPAGFTVVPGGNYILVVTFNPSIIGVINGTLTINSDDPDTPVSTVALTGEGVVPPEISIAPKLLVEALRTGETADHTLTITNSGGADLEWSLVFRDSLNSITREYALATPPAEAAPPDKEAPDPRPQIVRTEPLVAELQDLRNVKIMWEMAHGQGSSNGWSTLISDLTGRGATVTENTSPITPELLAGYDAVWTVDTWDSWDPSEIAALRNWLSAGGGLLIESDQSENTYNPILEGTGIIIQPPSAPSGITTNIYPHEVTENVQSFYLTGPVMSLSATGSQALKLVEATNNLLTAAVSIFGSGRVAVFSDEVFTDYGVGEADNQLLGNQLFDWLANAVGWLSADTTRGTIPGFSSRDLNVTFNATGLEGGSYEADLVVQSNDPDDPEVTSHAVLVVTPAPDIELTENAFDFGDVFVDGHAQRTLYILNNGVEDLVITHILSDDSDFSVDNTAMVIAPRGIHPLTITFAPTKAGVISASVSIISNDPDESVVVVSVTGQALLPPAIETDPSVFLEYLSTGEKSQQTLSITNTGVSDLEWNIEVASTDTVGTLSGVSILYDRTHGQAELNPTWVTALLTRGALVTNSYEPITRQLLDQHDIFLLRDITTYLMTSEITAIEGWVRDGGGLVLELDEYPTIGSANDILYYLNVAFQFSSAPLDSGYVTDITAHEITSGIDALYFPGCNARVYDYADTTLRLVRLDNGDAVSACAEVGDGRIFALSDELEYQPALNKHGNDNLQFLLQAFAWLSNKVTWLEVLPASGTTPSGVTDSPGVAFDATGLIGGTYAANIVVHHNDPNTSDVTIPAVLAVTSAPDISVSTDSVDFGVVFTTVIAGGIINVYNYGAHGLIVDSLIVTGDFFSTPTAPFGLAPGRRHDVVVEYAPGAEGPHSGLLQIHSNDPDQPVVSVVLTGEGLDPPIISVAPDSMSETLFSGDKAVQPLYIENTGSSDLVWSSRIDYVETGLISTYTLTTPPADAQPVVDNDEPAPRPQTVRTEPLVVQMEDLSGKKIVWDRAHGQGNSSYRSTLVSDLTTRGATFTENILPLTPALLSGFDVIWTIDSNNSSWTPAEIDAVRGWIAGGGAFLIESDQSGSVYNQILAGSGIVFSASSGAISGNTTNVYPHDITKDVQTVYLSGPVTYLETVVSPATRLVDDIAGHATCAAARVGVGRVTVFSDEMFDDYSITGADNQVLGNQAFGWLAGVGWLSLDRSSGVIAAGYADTLRATFDASTVEPGDHVANVVISSNDPDHPEETVVASLHAIAAPNIVVADSAIYFGTVYIGQTEPRQLHIENTGFDDLLVTGFATSDADFSVEPDSIVVSPHSGRFVDVLFAPSREDSIPATLTISSNDPHEPSIVVQLAGRGLEPPIVVVSPDTLSEVLYTGATKQRSLYVENAGGSDLNWTVRLQQADTTGASWYTLATPPADAVPPDENQPHNRPGTASSKPMVAKLGSLMGLNVMWEASHGQGSDSNWSTLITDIVARGATVDMNTVTITPELLDDYDVVWTIDAYSFSSSEISALLDWIYHGGSLLIEADESESVYNQILTGTGIEYSFTSASSGSTTNIYPHETTVNVASVYFGNPLASFEQVSVPGFRLVDDVTGRTVVAATKVGSGRILALADEIFNNYAIGSDFNQLFGNQVFDWFAGFPWLTVDPLFGTTAVGDTDTLAVTFDATTARPGEYAVNIVLESNDPVTPAEATPALLEIIGVPDIALGDTLLEFGNVFIGQTSILPLQIENAGFEDLLITSFVTSDADFSVQVDSLIVPPESMTSVDVFFAPTREDSIAATLTIECNDPDEPTVVVHLSGRGLIAPVIAVSPDTLREALYWGQINTQSMYVENPGGSDLHWSIETYQLGTSASKTYTLSTPPPDAAAAAGGKAGSNPQAVSPQTVTAQLRDLAGKRIMFEYSHGGSTTYTRSTMISDLLLRGAGITVNASPITPELLSDTDVLWTVQMAYAWSPDEINALQDWLYSGGALLIETDRSENLYSDLLAGTGLHYSYVSGYSGMTYNIFPHKMTENIQNLWFGSPLAHLDSVRAPAFRLVDDFHGDAIGAAAIYGSGRVVALADDALDNITFLTGGGDNQLFGNQVFDWLAGTLRWLSVEPGSGTTEAGTTDTLTVTFDATTTDPGEYAASITVESNDPVTPEASVFASLDITGTSDIEVSAAAIWFDTVIVGAAKAEPLTVYNYGNDELVVSGITVSDTATFYPSKTQFTVQPQRSEVLYVSFVPGAPVAYVDTLVIACNDPDEGTVKVVLAGVGIPAPDIVTAPDSLSEALFIGETAVHTLKIYNPSAAGSADLEFNITLHSVAADEEGSSAVPPGKSGKAGTGSKPQAVSSADPANEDEASAFLPWLSVSETEGVVNPGDSMSIDVTFDARNIVGGSYAGIIDIYTNVPGKIVFPIPVTLEATGVPAIAFSDTVLHYGEVFVGYPESRTFRVSNTGTDVLSVYALNFDHPGFTADPAAFDLPPAYSQQVEVTYSPPSAGSVSAILTAACNDTVPPHPRVILHAAALVPPVIAVSAESLSVTVDQGDTLQETITIYNNGGSDLDWGVGVVSAAPAPPSAGGEFAVSNDDGVVPDDMWEELLLSGRRTDLSTSPPRLFGHPTVFSDQPKVLWQKDRGDGNVTGWKIMINDILARGAIFTEDYGTITLPLLEAHDILWMGNLSTGLNSSEMAAITTWVQNGGNLLMEADNNVAVTSYAALLSMMSSGMTYSTANATPGASNLIYQHQMTLGVSGIMMPSPNARFSVNPPAGVLVADVNDVPIAVFSQVGDGRVVALSDQLLHDAAIVWEDNRLFGNNVFGWLEGFTWFSIAPASGTIGAGGNTTLTLTLDAVLAPPGAHEVLILLSSNDPANGSLVIPLDVFVRETGTMDLALDAGYNLRSWNVDTDTDSTVAVLGPIMDKLDNARGFDGGGLVYDPSIPPQFNTLTTMDHFHGYWIDVTEATVLSIAGGLVDHQTPMPLDAGYNLVCYLPSFADSVSHALDNVMDKVVVVLGYDGGGLTYDPAIPPEFNTLRKMKPGFGYWIRLTEPATLEYPLNPVRDKNEGIVVVVGGTGSVDKGESSALLRPEKGGDPTSELRRGREPTIPGGVSARGEPAGNQPQRRATRAREWISVWGDDIHIAGLPLAVGTIVTAVDPDGVVCGEFEVVREAGFGLMAVYKDDPDTDVDEGAQPGDAITIMIGDTGAFEGVRWTGMGDVVHFNDVASLISTEPDQLPRKYALYQNYPNPFNPTTTISYDLRDPGKVQLTVYNVRGERVRDIVNRHQGAGRYAVEWNGTNDAGQAVASGVYFFKLVAGDFVQTKKMILLK